MKHFYFLGALLCLFLSFNVIASDEWELIPNELGTELVDSTYNFDLVFISDSNTTWCEDFDSDQSIYYVLVDTVVSMFDILENVDAVDTSAAVDLAIIMEDPVNLRRVCVHLLDSTVCYEVYIVDSCPPLSIDEMIYSQLEFYPNPAKEMVNIYFKNDIQTNLTILDFSGRVVQTIMIKEGQSDYQLDVSKYPSGVYFVQVQFDGNLLQSEKLIIK